MRDGKSDGNGAGGLRATAALVGAGSKKAFSKGRVLSLCIAGIARMWCACLGDYCYRRFSQNFGGHNAQGLSCPLHNSRLRRLGPRYGMRVL